MRHLRTAAAAAMLALPAPAALAAGDRPPAMPARDATVVYRVEPAGKGAQVIRVFFGEGGDKLRIDGPGGQGSTVVDRRSGLVLVLMNAQHAFMEIPSHGPINDPFLLGDNMAYQRAGTTERIAGETCTDWRMTGKGGASTACVTGDGLLLAGSGVDGAGGQGRITALSVSFAPLPPSAFAAPAGFTRISHPNGAP